LSIWDYKNLRKKTGNYQQDLSKPCVIGRSGDSHPFENRIRPSPNSPIGKEEIEIAVEGTNNFALLNQ